MAYDAQDDGRRDFHFLYGRWRVEHHRLRERGVGSDDWDVFHSDTFCQGLMGGLCNVDENDFHDRGFQGLSFRAFNIETGQWAIYWVNSTTGALQDPVHGRFENGSGAFIGDHLDDEQWVKVVYRWQDITPASARWSQAFSYDGGQTWEINWVMLFTRAT